MVWSRQSSSLRGCVSISIPEFAAAARRDLLKGEDPSGEDPGTGEEGVVDKNDVAPGMATLGVVRRCGEPTPAMTGLDDGGEVIPWRKCQP